MRLDELYKPEMIPFEAEVRDKLIIGNFDRGKIKYRHICGMPGLEQVTALDFVHCCLVSWNLMDENGEMIPITVQVLYDLHPDVVHAIINGVLAAYQGKAPKLMQD